MTDDGAPARPDADRSDRPEGESWLAEQLRLMALEDGRGP